MPGRSPVEAAHALISSRLPELVDLAARVKGNRSPRLKSRLLRTALAASLCGCLALPMQDALAQQPAAGEVYRETDAVAAHYPDPSVKIDSPAFTTPQPHLTAHKEMMAFLAGLTASTPSMHIVDAGESQEGRAIPLLVFSREQFVQPADLLKSGKPTVMLIGLQHGNEPAAGEAALAFASEVAKDSRTNTLLDKINILIVPRANPDGAHHFMRGLVNGDDVNRDHLLQASPEGRTLGRIFAQYQPEVVLDSHEFTVAARWIKKFDALQSYDALIQYSTVSNLPPLLQQTAEKMFRKPLLKAFESNGLSHSWYYTTNARDDKKLLSMGGVVPDTGRNIAGLRNSIAFLLETRGVGIGMAHFKRRVFTHLVAIRSIAHSAAADSQDLLRINRQLRLAVTEQAGRGTLDVNGKATIERKKVVFRDPVNGKDRVVETDWASAFKIKPEITRPRPAGYVLKASEAAAAERLVRLGVTVERITAKGAIPGQSYKVTDLKETKRADVTGSAGAAKSAIRRITAELVDGSNQVEPGDFYIGLDQPLANLVIAALEPESQSSFPANGLIARNLSDKDIGSELPLFRVTQPAPIAAETIRNLDPREVR